MTPSRTKILYAVLLLPFWLAVPLRAEENPSAPPAPPASAAPPTAPKTPLPPKEYIRFVEDAQGARLQTGITTFRNAQGVTVDLVGAIHVADHAYYAQLNERFTHYDAVLYEMVGGPIGKRRKRLAHAALHPSTAPAVAAPAPSDAPSATKAAAPAPQVNSGPILTAEAVDSLPGFVRSPYTTPRRLVDATGAAPGSIFICPYTHRPFLIPGAQPTPNGKPAPAGAAAPNALSIEQRVNALENYLNKDDPHVKPPAAVPPPGANNAQEAEDAAEDAAAGRLAWLNTLSSTLQSNLKLESQLVGVDYYKANFVHADMSLTQFFKLQDERNEGFLALWWRSVKAQLDHPEAESANQPGLLKVLEILCRKDSATELKRLVGRTFDSVEMLMTGVEGKNGTVIIAERNKVALEVLQKQIALGKKRIAIFYGAAHLNDMETRLLSQGFTRVHHQWLTAWDLPPEPAPLPTPAQAP